MTAQNDAVGLREALARAETERDALQAIVLADDAKAIAEYEWERANKLATENTTLRAEVEQVKAERDAAVTKLRKATETYTDHNGAVWAPVPAWVHFAACQSSRDSRAHAARLAAQLTVTVEALKPFAGAADAYQHWHYNVSPLDRPAWAGKDWIAPRVTVGHLRRARTALATITPTEKDHA